MIQKNVYLHCAQSGKPFKSAHDCPIIYAIKIILGGFVASLVLNNNYVGVMRRSTNRKLMPEF